MKKYVYFDRETIQNILESENRGDKKVQTEKNNVQKVKIRSNIEGETGIDFNVPFVSRLKFLFTSRLDTEFFFDRNSKVSISSTEISEFERIKNNFEKKENIKVSDIKNSSTALMVATSYLKILNGSTQELKDFNFEQFREIQREFSGYDVYQISENEYVRFNFEGFISNYRRNELLTSKLDLFVQFVGEFEDSEFDLPRTLTSFGELLGGVETKSLADLENQESESEKESNMVMLYDVIVANIHETGGS